MSILEEGSTMLGGEEVEEEPAIRGDKEAYLYFLVLQS